MVKVFKTRRTRIVWSILTLLVLVSVTACQGATPPGPDVASTKIGNTNCTLLIWKEGLHMALWFDIADTATSGGSGNTSDPLYHERGTVSAADGRKVEWTVDTADGKSATFSIGAQTYDLARGTLFMVSTPGGKVGVRQVTYDLANLSATRESCNTLAESSPDVKSFIAAAGGPNP